MTPARVVACRGSRDAAFGANGLGRGLRWRRVMADSTERDFTPDDMPEIFRARDPRRLPSANCFEVELDGRGLLHVGRTACQALRHALAVSTGMSSLLARDRRSGTRGRARALWLRALKMASVCERLAAPPSTPAASQYRAIEAAP